MAGYVQIPGVKVQLLAGTSLTPTTPRMPADRVQLASTGVSLATGLAFGFSQIAGFSMYASTSVANGSSFTQIQAREAIFVSKNFSKLKITIGNILTSNAGDVTLPDATWRVGLYDPLAGVWYDVNFGGSASVVLTSGQIVTSDIVNVSSAGAGNYPVGKLLYLIKYVVYASAPANFPAARYFAAYGNLNEWGNSLTDKTRSGVWAFARPAGNFNVVPVLAVTGARARTPVVAVLGDSIGSEFIADTLNDYLSGWTSNGLALNGVPYINVGSAGLGIGAFMLGSQAAKRARIYASMVAAGVTHCFCTLGTNDLSVAAGPLTGAQIYAAMQALQAELAAFNIKLIPIRIQPRTNATNDGVPVGETNAFTERAIYNGLVGSNNGVGYGYYDLAVILAGADPNLWRVDLNRTNSIAINAAGANYVATDLLNLPSGVRIQVTTVTAGAAATATLRRGGAFLVAPSNPVAQVSGYNATASGNWQVGGATLGSGANFNLTNGAAGFDSSDGVHQGPTYHAWAQQDFTTKVPTLFTL